MAASSDSVPRSRAELLEFFEEQLGFLELSSTAFDSGKLAESKRLAQVMRTLFHHTADRPRGGMHALINQLGLHDTLTWVATAGKPDPRNLEVTWGLVQVGFDIGAGKPVFRAPLDDWPPKRIRTTIGNLPLGSRIFFDGWWNDPVTKDGEGMLFSRKDFVLALANKEGGAHVDPQIDAAYNKIANSNSMGWTFEAGDSGLVPLSNPVPYAVRQIAYEVVESVRQQRDRIR